MKQWYAMYAFLYCYSTDVSIAFICTTTSDQHWRFHFTNASRLWSICIVFFNPGQMESMFVVTPLPELPNTFHSGEANVHNIQPPNKGLCPCVTINHECDEKTTEFNPLWANSVENNRRLFQHNFHKYSETCLQRPPNGILPCLLELI